jgi:hypothetical protein
MIMATCRGNEAFASGLRWAERALTVWAAEYSRISWRQNQKHLHSGLSIIMAGEAATLAPLRL